MVTSDSNRATVSSSSDVGGSQGVWLQPEEAWQVRQRVERRVVSLAVCKREECESVREWRKRSSLISITSEECVSWL